MFPQPPFLLAPTGPVRYSLTCYALPSSLFAHLLLHCPVRYSLTCFCTAQFAIRSPAFALPSSLFAHLLLHCEGPQALLVSKAATGPSRVESSHRTFSCRKQPPDLLVSKAATKITDFSVASSFA